MTNRVIYAALAIAMLAVPAHATTKRICNTWTGQCWWERDGVVVAKPRPKRTHTHKRVTPRVRGYTRREHEDSDRVVCKDVVTVIGDARPSESSAREDAEAVFMRTVRYKYGESWMSPDNARDYASRCARASITEIVGQVMVRCEIKAKPCRAPFESR